MKLNAIISGQIVIGIELGSTRIKTVLIGEDTIPIASGSHDWENSYVKDVFKDDKQYCNCIGT
jgi:sugar (pentulose or hexulose) kinase